MSALMTRATEKVRGTVGSTSSITSAQMVTIADQQQRVRAAKKTSDLLQLAGAVVAVLVLAKILKKS